MGVLLAVDVGNTNVVIGAYRGTTLLRTWRAATDVDRTEDELAVMLDALLAQEELRIADVASLVVGSVVPPLTLAFTRLAERHLEGRVLVIGPGVKTGVRLRVDNPSEVGADRIANTLAAHRRYGGPAIVVDFGTSTSFDVVSAEGDFLGGAFAPGLEISSESLFGRASRLFRVPL
ncbi:MAG: type III pantothenate kinase, partial [Chloroflexota bacterium]